MDGTTQNFQFDKDADENDPNVELLSTDWKNKPLKDNNSLRDYKFDFGDKTVKKLDINLPGSGAIAYLNYKRKTQVPEPISALALLFSMVAAGSLLKRKKS